jgi:PAS domain S-box-containing protein
MKPEADDAPQTRIFQRHFSRNRLFLYLIPIVIGTGGIAVSMQLQDLYVRIIVLMLSVAIPLFAGGNVLARYRTARVERFLLGLGLAMLIFGATLSVSGLSSAMAWDLRAWVAGENLSRLLGVLSLMLGLAAILFTLGRTGEDIVEIGERFRHLAAHMSEGIVLSDSQGQIILVNEQFLEIIGLKEKDVLGTRITDLALRFGMSAVLEHIERRRQGMATAYNITFNVRGEERHIIVHGKPIFDSSGNFTATLATFRDNTEEHQLRQRVERYAGSLEHLVEEQTQRLSESEERLRQLLLTMSEGFITIDAGNRVRFVNERMLQLSHCTRGDMLGRELTSFLDTPSRIRLLNLLAREPGSDAEIPRQELTFLSSDGKAIPMMAAVNRMPDAAAGGPVYSIVLTDISELKAMELQLRERADQLEQANEELRLHDRAKDSFLSNVSHELRTPLATVNGYVEMLATGTLGELPPEQQRVIGVMRRNLDRLAGLINEIIEFSRMEIRGLELSLSLFNVEDLVNEAAASALPGAAEKDVAINISIGNAPGHAWGDRRRLQQVLAILLNNAVKFSRQGGTITIEASKAAGDVQLSVTDDGIGIDPAFHEKVFEKFFQVDSSKTRRYEGAGIGLSIAKSIAESHGGGISLASELGKGSTFTVRLPGAAFEEAVPVDASLLADSHVVLVDEPGWSTELFERMLLPCAAGFTRVDGTHQLIRRIEQGPVGLILIDAGPSDRAGLGLERVLAQHPVAADVPRIVMTQETPATMPEMRDAATGTFFLTKPFGARDFFDTVRQILRGERDTWNSVAGEPMAPHVVVVNEAPEMLAFVELALTTRQIPCCMAHDPEQAVQIARQVPVRALVIDTESPGVPLEEYLRPLKEAPETKGAPIYFLTGVEDGFHGFPEVSGMLRKPFTAGQLAAMLQNEEDGRSA